MNSIEQINPDYIFDEIIADGNRLKDDNVPNIINRIEFDKIISFYSLILTQNQQKMFIWNIVDRLLSQKRDIHQRDAAVYFAIEILKMYDRMNNSEHFFNNMKRFFNEYRQEVQNYVNPAIWNLFMNKPDASESLYAFFQCFAIDYNEISFDAQLCSRIVKTPTNDMIKCIATYFPDEYEVLTSKFFMLTEIQLRFCRQEMLKNFFEDNEVFQSPDRLNALKRANKEDIEYIFLKIRDPTKEEIEFKNEMHFDISHLPYYVKQKIKTQLGLTNLDMTNSQAILREFSNYPSPSTSNYLTLFNKISKEDSKIMISHFDFSKMFDFFVSHFSNFSPSSFQTFVDKYYNLINNQHLNILLKNVTDWEVIDQILFICFERNERNIERMTKDFFKIILTEFCSNINKVPYLSFSFLTQCSLDQKIAIINKLPPLIHESLQNIINSLFYKETRAQVYNSFFAKYKKNFLQNKQLNINGLPWNEIDENQDIFLILCELIRDKRDLLLLISKFSYFVILNSDINYITMQNAQYVFETDFGDKTDYFIKQLSETKPNIAIDVAANGIIDADVIIKWITMLAPRVNKIIQQPDESLIKNNNFLIVFNLFRSARVEIGLQKFMVETLYDKNFKDLAIFMDKTFELNTLSAP